MMLKRMFFLLMPVSLLFSCEKNEPDSLNKFSDPVIRKIYEFKDQRLSDSLYQYFTREEVVYRNEAALAFASIQDTTAVDHLTKFLIRERDTTVRTSIALALGQTPSQHCERILLGALMREKNPSILKELLEAYGKTTSHWQLIQPSFLEDTVKAEGLAWSIFRAGYKGKVDTSVNKIAGILIDQKHHAHTQLGVAHFFARNGKDFKNLFQQIANIAQHDPSPDVRMAATLALGKIPGKNTLDVFESILKNENDHRVRINTIKALQNFPFGESKTWLYATLYDKYANVGIAASEVIKALATNENWIELSNLTTRVENWRIQANLYEASLSKTDNKALVTEVITNIKQTLNPYHKAALITALQSNLSSFDFISDVMITADTPVVRSSAALALAAMTKHKNFNSDLRRKFAKLAEQTMPVSDLAVIGTFAEVLANPALNFRSVITDIEFLKKARKQLSLPQDNEALQPLEAAIAYFEQRDPQPVVNEFNNPIDWDLVQTIRKDQRVVIKTSRGHITLRLYVEEAPGSVANFVKLVKSDYYDKKLFHRVVPNFVIQAGCNRGDGWGGEDYSIRSEFTHLRYKAGSVGMASAGKDTEGTQWFITHSPTPHLDGRYTIFAEVVDGLEVVNLIEVGDQILDIELIK